MHTTGDETEAIGAYALGAFIIVGCTVEPSSYSSDADVGTTHALVSIERTVPARALEEGWRGGGQVPDTRVDGG